MLKKIWEIIEDIAGRNDKEKEQDAIKVQQNVEDFISNAKASFNDNYSKIINSKENMSNSITSNNFNERNNIWNQIQENAERSVGIVKNNIGNFGNDTGRTVENTWLGATSGTKQSLKYLTKFGENINGGARYYKDGNEIKLTDLPNYLTEEQLKKLKNINEEVKDKLGFNMDKKLQSSINKDQEKIQKNIENQGNSVSKKLAELAPSMGNMIPGMVASSVNPVLGATYFTASSGGSYIDDAKERGMTDEQAFSYGTMMGIMEGITEGVTVGNFKKAGTAINSIIKETGKEAAKKGTEQLAKTSIKQVLKDYGIGIADNAIQEAIMEPIQETVAGAIGGKEKSDWHNMGQRMLQSGINGGLVGAIVGGGNMGIQSCAAVVEKINNGKTPSNTEIKLAIKDASKELDVEKMIQDSVIQQTNKYKNYHTETVVDNINTNISNQTQNVISNNQNMQQNAIQNQSKTQGQQIISTQNQNIQKSDIVENNNTKIAKMKNFDESAKQYNIDYKNEDLKEIKQMFDRRGINAYFDENTFKNNDDAFSVWKPIYDEQGNVADREVVFNPKTQDTNTRVQELAIHELGHDLDLNEVQNMILKDASKKENWENARKSLENTYKQAYENDNIQISDENFNKIVDEEATMSILQRELGNQEYVNRLVNQNKSVAKKIYNWVIDKLNKFTGGKNEKIFWTDIRNKFETAYNQEFSKYDSNLKYSVAGKEALKNIKEPQLSQEAYNSYNKAKQMAKNKESNEKIYKETGWYKDKVTGKMKFNFSDKDMKIANQNYKVGQEFKLKDILIHNTLFEMYPQLRDYKVKIEDMNSNNTKNNGRLNGRYNRFTDELTIDINRFNDISNAEGTLIHEIQHAIQKIEGFAGGTSIKFGKEKYKNNPGEIEARDTSKRMIEEKYNGKDLSNIMPKSANVNTSILEKMKIGLYNYLSNISNEEVSNEFNESNKKKNSSNASENNGLVLGGIEKNNVESENNSGSFSIKNNNVWRQFVENNYQKQGTGQNLKEYNLPTKESTKTELNLPIKENINTQGESINWNEIERPEGKIRKHYKSIIESSNTTKEAKSIAKELMGTDTYVPETNKSQLVQADARINNSSPEAELKSLMNRATTGGKIEAVDIAVGERLIQYYSKVGDKTNLQEAIQATAMAGTNAGKTVQALSMLNHQTPEGQATWIQRSVDKMNNELAKKKGGTITKDSDGNIKVINKQGKDITGKVDLFDLTPEMIEKITSSKDKETMYKNIDSVYEELGNQVPKSTIEKIDSWRYFSMLANPRTHIRNMVGNVAMGKTQRIKDKLAGGIEGIVNKFNPEMERTKTIAFANKKTKEFVKEDFKNIDVQSRLELNENKYNPQSRLQNSRKTFKHDIFEKTLGKLFNLNDNLLEAEDGLGLKSSYKKALADYITSNKIDVDNITDKQLSKARNYAIEQAKEATFHQANSIASAINQFSGKNKLTKGVTDAVLPFVKTPMNVAKAGMEYNPVGLLKTLTYDTAKLRKGDININKYIDNLSKGLTGTGIAVLGYALADAGMLKASGGDDDKKENYDEATGSQAYSIEIAGKTYSLDWLAPVGIPLFTGAEAYSIQKSGTEEKNNVSSDDNKKINQILKSLENWSNAMSKSMSPMSEMSMISGLTSALSSYNEDKLSAMGTNAVKSYVNQFVPTLIGQIAKTSDEYERSTTSTKTGLISKAIDQTKLQITSKIPGLRKTLPVKTDIWGNKQKQEENLPIRALNNFINPSTVKEVTKDKVDNEINNLYSKNGEKSILPVSSIDKTFKIDGTTYRMTSEEYSKYKTDYGKNSYNLINNLISTKQYQKLTDNQKQKAIENIYTYVKEKNKVNYAKSVNKEVKTSTLYNTLEDLKKHGGEQSDYLSYIAKTEGISKDKEKEEILANADYSDTTKSIIYKTAINSRDKKYLDLEKIDFPITEYLKYKSQDFVSDKDEDGESIKGSKSKKVYNYLNNISESKLSDDYKKIICRIEEISDYDNDVVNFINKQKLSIEDKTSLLKNIGFKINKDGYIQTYSRIPITKYVK
jgi:hypothetical protein